MFCNRSRTATPTLCPFNDVKIALDTKLSIALSIDHVVNDFELFRSFPFWLSSSEDVPN